MQEACEGCYLSAQNHPPITLSKRVVQRDPARVRHPLHGLHMPNDTNDAAALGPPGAMAAMGAGHAQ